MHLVTLLFLTLSAVAPQRVVRAAPFSGTATPANAAKDDFVSQLSQRPDATVRATPVRTPSAAGASSTPSTAPARPPYQFWRDPVVPLLLTVGSVLAFEGYRTMRYPWRAVSDSPYAWQVQLDNLNAAQRDLYRRLAPWHEYFGGDVGPRGQRGEGARGPGGLEWMRCLRVNKDRTYLPLASKLLIWERCARRLQRLGFEPPADMVPTELLGPATGESGSGAATGTGAADEDPRQQPPLHGDEHTDNPDDNRREFRGASVFDGLRDAATRMSGGVAGAVGAAMTGAAMRRVEQPRSGAGKIPGGVRRVWMPRH